jgi:protocatechuate 3,4-dioxygenase beta subunit
VSKADHALAGSLVTWAVAQEPGSVEFMPVAAVLADAVRKNDKRPAHIKLLVPDSWSRNLTGDEAMKDAFLLARVPRELAERWSDEVAEARSAASSGSETL